MLLRQLHPAVLWLRQALWLLPRLSLIHQPSPRITVCKSFSLAHQLRSVVAEVWWKCVPVVLVFHIFPENDNFSKSKLFTPPPNMYADFCVSAFVALFYFFSFFVSKAYLVKGLFFSLPVLTSSRVFNYRLSTRLSPASPTHFYPACRKKHPSREVSAVTWLRQDWREWFFLSRSVYVSVSPCVVGGVSLLRIFCCLPCFRRRSAGREARVRTPVSLTGLPVFLGLPRVPVGSPWSFWAHLPAVGLFLLV